MLLHPPCAQTAQGRCWGAHKCIYPRFPPWAKKAQGTRGYASKHYCFPGLQTRTSSAMLRHATNHTRLAQGPACVFVKTKADLMHMDV